MGNRLVSRIAALLIWLGCVYEIGTVGLTYYQGRLQDMPILGQLLTQKNDNIAPIAVLIVLGWLLFEILLHAWRVWRESSALQQFKTLTPQNINIGRANSRTRAGRRAKLVKDLILSNPDHLHEALPASAALDVSALDNHYSLTKVYVWILPVIGFIGTAWGMANAISGFSETLGETKGNISDIALLVDRLGQLVIPGLANAFTVTMLALGASIVAHFCVSVVQSWDQDILDSLDQASVELLSKIPKDSGIIPKGSKLARAAISDELTHALQGMTTQLNEISRKIDLGDSARLLNEAAQNLTNASSETMSAANEVTKAAEVLKDSVNAPYQINITRRTQK